MVCLVYWRRPTEEEPLVAIAASEEAAVEIERHLTSSGGGVRVSWEEFPVRRGDGSQREDVADGLEVHVVTIGDRSDSIGLGVFDTLQAAQEFARGQQHSEIEIRSLRVGWLDPNVAV